MQSPTRAACASSISPLPRRRSTSRSRTGKGMKPQMNADRTGMTAMTRTIRIAVNGTAREVEVPAYRTLLDCLRYDLGLTGSKEGCGVGVCGACTVLLDGKMVSSCIALAVFADGREVTTVEGLAKDE